MAFYDKAPSKFPKKRDFANEGPWEEEGSRYSDRKPSAGSRRFGPNSDRPARGGEHRDFRSNDRRDFHGDRPREDRRDFHNGDRRDFHGDRPREERRDFRGNDRRDFHGDRPRDDRRDFRGNDRRDFHGDRPQRGPRNDRRDDRRLADQFAPRPAYMDAEYRPAPAPVMPVNEEEVAQPNENLLAGRNPIREALKSGRDIEKLLVQRGELTGSAREIVQMARDAHVVVQEVDKQRLDELAPHHQGMLAFASAYQYSTVADMLAEAQEKGEDPFLILLDGVTDPHNLGAIIRSAECVGAHGVIVPERRSVGLTPAAVKASAGAIEHMKVARVTNLNRTIEELKQKGVWTYALTMDGEDYERVNFKGGVALVVGSEGEGVSRLTLENCDMKVSLPMAGAIDSLNASVAASIMMYRVLSSRRA